MSSLGTKLGERRASSATSTATPKAPVLSKNGKRVGRPPLSAEDKAAKEAARKAAAREKQNAARRAAKAQERAATATPHASAALRGVAPQSHIVSAVHQRAAGMVKEWAGLHGMSEDEYKAAVAQHMQRMTDTATISVRRSARSLEDILDNGRFKSVHESGRSSTTSTPEETTQYAAQRAEYEHNVFGYNPKTSGAQGPIYGYLADKGRDAPSAGAYGPVRIVLKPSVRERTTATFGDSLVVGEHAHYGNVPRPMTSMQWDATNYISRPEHAFGKAVAPQAWARIMDPLRVKSISDFSKKGPMHYVEAQIHHGLARHDIAQVVFDKGYAPRPELQAKLKVAGIKWRVTGETKQRATRAKTVNEGR